MRGAGALTFPRIGIAEQLDALPAPPSDGLALRANKIAAAKSC